MSEGGRTGARAVLARLVPRRFATRVILLLLLALLVSQAVGAAFLIGERQRAVAQAVREQVGERVVQTVRLMDALPSAQHARVLEVADRRTLRYWRSAESAAAGDRPDMGRRLAHFARRSPSDVAVDFGEAATPPAGEPPRTRRSGAILPMTVSVRMEQGDWLNASAVVRLPQPGWALAAVASMVVMAVALVGIVIVSVRRLNRPLDDLVRAADRIGRGEETAPVPERGPDDLRRVVAAFNRMQDRIQRHLAERTRILGAIAHDLRTPLTSLRLRAEMVDDAGTREGLLATIEEMSRTVEAGLTLARDAAVNEPVRTVDLDALAGSLVEDLRDLGLDVAYEGPGRVELPCRPTSLRRALRNLIQNAATYGERARVRLDAAGGPIVLRVEDEGPGLPENCLEAVFEPFARIDPSRSAESGGLGLGLTIARGIARAHGGDVVLANRSEGGLVATLTLPQAQADRVSQSS